MGFDTNESTFLKAIKKVDSAITLIEESFVGISLISVSIFAFINVICRYFFNNSLNWVGEISTYALVWITFVGGSICARHGAHVSMDILLARLSGWAYRYVMFIIGILCVIASLCLMYYGIVFTGKVLNSGQLNPILNISAAWLFLGVPVGFGLMFKNFTQFFMRTIFLAGEEE